MWKKKNTAAPDSSPLLKATIEPITDASPVFVLGSVRSGTSIMATALRDGAGIPGFHEGNVTGLYRKILDQVEDHWRRLGPVITKRPENNLVSNLDPEVIRALNVNQMGALYREHMGAGRWFDKSPESTPGAPTIRMVPTLAELFPEARFVFCVRRGIENLRSQLTKFPNIDFGVTCRAWRDVVLEWQQAKEAIPGRFVEVHQHEIAIRPEKVAAALRAGLDLDAEQEAGLVKIFSGRRSEQSQVGQEHRSIGLDETGWPEARMRTFHEICGEAMTILGHRMEGETLATAGPVELFYPIVTSAIEYLGSGAVEEGFQRRGQHGFATRAEDGGSGVRWPAIPLDGHDRFEATVSAAEGAAELTLEVRTHQSVDPVVRENLQLADGEEKAWSFAVPQAPRGEYVVSIHAKGSGSVVTWQRAQFSISDAAGG